MRQVTRISCPLVLAALLGGIPAIAGATEKLISPRLEKLFSEIRSGNSEALDSFWAEAREKGTPLVESVASDAEQVIVTFLWRGGQDTRNVILFSPLTVRPNMDFTDRHLARGHLRRLEGTDVWFRSFRLRDDARLSYYLSPNDPLLPFRHRNSESDWASLQPDPLNPKRYVLAHEGEEWIRSIVDLPGAGPVPWVTPGENIPRGGVEEHSMPSAHLGNERRFWVYTPAGYAPDGAPYRLLVLFDGWQAVHMDPTTTVLDNLSAAGRIEPVVAVMVGQQDRMRELGCNDGFNRFLVLELLPWIRNNYNVSGIPSQTTVGGTSAGGLAAVYVAWRHPEVFGNVISQSGYFSWDPLEADAEWDEELEFEWLTRQIAERPTADIRLVLSVGTLEHDHDFLYSPSFLRANRHMRDVLRARGYEFTYLEVTGGHDVYSSAMTFPGLLMEMSGLMEAAPGS